MVVESKDEDWITAEEKELVLQLRERVKEVLPRDELEKEEEDQVAFLLRWLRARELNLDKAENMLLAAIKWRDENKLDQALNREPDKFMHDTYRWKIIASDVDGRPVAICPFNEWDFRKMLNANKADEFEPFMQTFFETVLSGIREYNKQRPPGKPPVTQFLPILDVGSYPYGQMLSLGAMRKWFHMSSTYEAYYPEVLFRVICINCPGYFQLFLNMLKGFLVPKTLAKFICYSTVEEWKKDIGKYMDPAEIPEQYGGTMSTNPLKSNA